MTEDALEHVGHWRTVRIEDGDGDPITCGRNDPGRISPCGARATSMYRVGDDATWWTATCDRHKYELIGRAPWRERTRMRYPWFNSLLGKLPGNW